MEEAIKEYRSIKQQIDLLEQKLEEKKELIKSVLPPTGFKFENVNAFWKSSKKWKYSLKVDEIKKQLDGQKELEELDGTAIAEETRVLQVNIK